MNFWQFRNQFYELACFNVNQVYAWQPHFDKNNFTRWCKQNLIVKLRNSWYCFPEYLNVSNFQYFISNKIYSPSYISLHSALSFYGVIPEAIVTSTAVSTLKKASFENRFGSFSYQKIAPELMFGYEQKSYLNKNRLLIAYPEKAILDLLYLYPIYNTTEEMKALRFDEDFMHEELNILRLKEFCEKFQSKIMENRVDLLLKTYDLC